MAISIVKVGCLYRWIVRIGTKCTGDVAATWDEAVTEAHRAAEAIKKAATEGRVAVGKLA